MVIINDTYKNSPYLSIQEEDERRLIFYRQIIEQAYNFHPQTPLSKSNKVIHKREISRFFEYDSRPKDQKIKIDERLIYLADTQIIREEELEFLKKDENACAYAFFSLHIEKKSLAPNSGSFLERIIPFAMIINSHIDRYRAIANAFGNSYEGGYLASYRDFLMGQVTNISPTKINLIRKIKENISLIRRKKDPLTWLAPTDIDSITWAWEYTQKYSLFQQNIIIQSLLESNQQRPINLLEAYQPTTAAEMRLALIAISYTLNISQSIGHRQYMQDMSKAWNQRCLRKNTRKKAINTYIDSSTKEKLDLMAKCQRITMSEMLEWLIEDNYDTYKIRRNDRYVS